MTAQRVPASVSLHAFAQACDAFSVASYNVLLPNSGTAGWWVTKYYDSTVPEGATSWPHRQGLLQEHFRHAAADILCLQELSGDSLKSDFAFLADAGYHACIHRKYHLRPATLWKSSVWSLVHERHTDKVLAVLLREVGRGGRCVAVLNVHLAAAPDPRRRFRQVFDAVDRLRKDTARLGLQPDQLPILVCGDFNAPAAGSGTDAFLRGQAIGPDYREPWYPAVSLSSKVRAHPFGTFRNAYASVLGRDPMTLFGGRVLGLDPAGGPPPPALLHAIDQLFDRFAVGDRMSWDRVEAWLTVINGAPDRGSERRAAEALVEGEADRSLSRTQFRALYLAELSQGKYWSVQHDLQVTGLISPDAARGMYMVPLDRIYASSSLTLLGVWEPLSPARLAQLHAEQIGLPCAWHPSDHLPLGAVVRFPS